MSQHTRSHVTTHTVTCHNIQCHMSQHTGSHVTTYTVTCHNIHGHMSQHTGSHVTTHTVTCHNIMDHLSTPSHTTFIHPSSHFNSYATHSFLFSFLQHSIREIFNIIIASFIIIEESLIYWGMAIQILIHSRDSLRPHLHYTPFWMLHYTPFWMLHYTPFGMLHYTPFGLPSTSAAWWHIFFFFLFYYGISTFSNFPTILKHCPIAFTI